MLEENLGENFQKYAMWKFETFSELGEEEILVEFGQQCRRLYLDFEGDMEEGRGKVHRIDRGTYEILEKKSHSFFIEFSGENFCGKYMCLDEDQKAVDFFDGEKIGFLGKVP